MAPIVTRPEYASIAKQQTHPTSESYKHNTTH